MSEGGLQRRIERVREAYSDLYAVRAIVQAIPHLGGTIDTLLAGGASSIRLSRVEDFLSIVEERMRVVERIEADLKDEAFYDLVLMTLEKVVRTRSAGKRARFANILTRQVVRGTPWEDAENAVRLLAELDDLHVEVIQVALRAPELHRPFTGLRVIGIDSVVSPEEGRDEPPRLGDAVPHYSQTALRMACAELVARGLLKDEGVGRLGTPAMNYFVATDLAWWFADWLNRDMG